MRRLAAVLLALALALGGAAAAAVGSAPDLAAHGPTAVSGTEATAVFRVGGRTVRQVRYADRERLTYSFVLENQGRLPVTVVGLAPLPRTPRLFAYADVTDGTGRSRFGVPAGGRRTVEVGMVMHACETLSARAGSFATEVALRVERAGGLVDDVVTVTFPEEVHTGSPREASCPEATATSRPPG